MAPRATFTIAGIPGSLRGDSFNRRLLETVAYELPPGTTLEIWDGLEHVAPFNEAHVFQRSDDAGRLAHPELSSRLTDLLGDLTGRVVAEPVPA